MSKAVEEQQRYTIDEDNHKESKILSEEQSRILHKLLKANSAILSDEERDLVYQLQDKLDKETERVKSLKEMTVGDKPLDQLLSQHMEKKAKVKADSDDEEWDEELPEMPTHRHIVGFKPEEVVQQYIECWNQQKFGAEFDCFSPSFMKTDRDTYKEARQKFFQSQIPLGGMKIVFSGIESSNVMGTEADVTANKTVTVGNQKPKNEKDTYILKLESGKWYINGVKPA